MLVAGGWREASALAGQKDSSLDLLLTDVVMAEMSGRDLSGRVRAPRPGLRVLHASGYTVDVIAHHGILEEGVHFIQKPLSFEVLAKKLRQALGA